MIRRLLLALLACGLIGTAAELWLMGHHESAWQAAPFAAMACALGAGGWCALSGSAIAVRVFQLAMALLMLAGVTGTVLHYRATMEFQLEMDASLGGFALLTRVLQAKAPPALAPGNMALLGLVGLVATYRLTPK